MYGNSRVRILASTTPSLSARKCSHIFDSPPSFTDTYELLVSFPLPGFKTPLTPSIDSTLLPDSLPSSLEAPLVPISPAQVPRPGPQAVPVEGLEFHSPLEEQVIQFPWPNQLNLCIWFSLQAWDQRRSVTQAQAPSSISTPIQSLSL